MGNPVHYWDNTGRDSKAINLLFPDSGAGGISNGQIAGGGAVFFGLFTVVWQAKMRKNPAKPSIPISANKGYFSAAGAPNPKRPDDDVNNDIDNVDSEYQELYKKNHDHIFSKAHRNDGILNLGESESDIFNKMMRCVEDCKSQWVEGQNEIHTVINELKVTIRITVNNGSVTNINGFVGYSERIIGNLIVLVN